MAHYLDLSQASKQEAGDKKEMEKLGSEGDDP
jgi:hypothetical protein